MGAEKLKPRIELDHDYQLMSEQETEEALGRHRRTLKRWAENGKFPEPIQLADRTWAWIKSEVQAHIAKKKDGRKKPTTA